MIDFNAHLFNISYKRYDFDEAVKSNFDFINIVTVGKYDFIFYICQRIKDKQKRMKNRRARRLINV